MLSKLADFIRRRPKLAMILESAYRHTWLPMISTYYQLWQFQARFIKRNRIKHLYNQLLNHLNRDGYLFHRFLSFFQHMDHYQRRWNDDTVYPNPIERIRNIIRDHNLQSLDLFERTYFNLFLVRFFFTALDEISDEKLLKDAISIASLAKSEESQDNYRDALYAYVNRYYKKHESSSDHYSRMLDLLMDHMIDQKAHDLIKNIAQETQLRAVCALFINTYMTYKVYQKISLRELDIEKLFYIVDSNSNFDIDASALYKELIDTIKRSIKDHVLSFREADRAHVVDKIFGMIMCGSFYNLKNAVLLDADFTNKIDTKTIITKTLCPIELKHITNQYYRSWIASTTLCIPLRANPKKLLLISPNDACFDFLMGFDAATYELMDPYVIVEPGNTIGILTLMKILSANSISGGINSLIQQNPNTPITTIITKFDLIDRVSVVIQPDIRRGRLGHQWYRVMEDEFPKITYSGSIEEFLAEVNYHYNLTLTYVKKEEEDS